MNQEERIKQLEEEIAKLKGEKPFTPSEPWQPIDYTANMRMPPSALAAMVACVPDRLMRDIVADNRHRSEPRSALPDPPRREEPEQPKGTGFSEPLPLKPPPGVAILDNIMDHQDAADKREAIAKRVDEAIKSKLGR